MSLQQSDDIKQLLEARLKARAEYKKVEKGRGGQKNSKYATLEDLMNATEGALIKNGLEVYHQEEAFEDGRVKLHTRLSHLSGQWMASTTWVLMPTNSPLSQQQTYGSSLTYQKRYSYQSLLGIVGEDDDDGQSSAPKTPWKNSLAEFTPSKEPSTAKVVEGLSYEQFEEIYDGIPEIASTPKSNQATQKQPERKAGKGPSSEAQHRFINKLVGAKGADLITLLRDQGVTDITALRSDQASAIIEILQGM